MERRYSRHSAAMNYLSKSLIVFGYFVLSVTFAPAASDDLPGDALFSARAQPHATGTESYIEYYLDDPSADDFSTYYFSQEGDALARKRLRYNASADYPLFEIHDYRTSTGFRVLPTDGRLRIQTLRLLENNYQAVVDVQEVPVIDPTVVDAGFHRFVHQHWDEFAAGESIRFHYLQVDQARLIPMVMERVDCAQPGLLCVRAVLSNLIHRFFVPPVLLTYEERSRRLLLYSGYGPLPTVSGDAFPVTLKYTYLN